LDLGFERIIFESGDVTFEHDDPLESSCYKEVRNSNMLMLIVGWRYGSESIMMGLDEYSRNIQLYMMIDTSIQIRWVLMLMAVL